MKTIFKRAAAWLMAVMMIVNCIPVYAQDSSTDYSGQQISLADYLTESEDITVTFVINNANYTNDPGSGVTHVTSETAIEGGDFTYTSWGDAYKVTRPGTDTGTVCSYTIPAGTSLSENNYSLPPLSAANSCSEPACTYSYVSAVSWITEDNKVCTVDTVFEEDTTLALQLYENGERYSVNYRCGCPESGTHTVASSGFNFKLGQGIPAEIIAAVIEKANTFSSQYCSHGSDHNEQVVKFQLKRTSDGVMVDLEPDMPITKEYEYTGETFWAYAVWEATSTPVTAKFQYVTTNATGGETVQFSETRELKSGDKLGTLPAAPAYVPNGTDAPQNATFVGWQYTDESGAQQYATADTVITADTVFNAVFTTQVKATFQYTITNAEGVQTTTVVAERFLNPGDALGTLPNMKAYEHDGRSFVGWKYTDENGSQQYADSSTVIKKDTVYTAVFTVKATFQYVYVEEDETEVTKNVAVYKLKPGDPLGALPDMSAYETAFEIFDGWQYAVDGNGEPQYAAPDMIVNEDITLTAVFVEPELGEVIFHDVLPDPDKEIEISEFMPVGMTLAEVLEYIGYAPDDGYEVSECIWRTADGALADMNAVVTAENPIELFTYMYRVVMTLNLNTAEETAVPGTRALVSIENANGVVTMTIDAREGEPLTAADFVTPEGIDLTRYVWKDKDGNVVDLQGLIDNGLKESITATSNGTLTADAENTIIVRFLLNGNAIYVANVPSGTDLAAWIAANSDAMTNHVIAGSKVRLGAFDWTNSDGSAIAGGQTVTEDMAVHGALRNVTVTFYSDSSKTQQVGNTLTLAYGEKVSAGNFPTVDAVQDGKSFVEWRYTGTEGEMRFDEHSAVYEDMQVYAHYAQMRTLTFYADDKMDTPIKTVQTPDGEPFDTSKYPPVTPPEGQTLRYWVVVRGEAVQVFNPLLPVTEDMNLYPVFDKYVFVLMDADTGKKITSIYEGDPVNFTVKAPEGYYYVGVRLKDGTLIETDGEQMASTDLFKVTDAVGGQYEVDVTPEFDKQLNVVYHTGAGAMFLVAPDAETYTQTVNASVRLQGALDIVRTDGSVGLTLSGWARTPDATLPEFDISETLTNEQLKAYANANGEIHLYPVWQQAADAVKITFVSNYPADAVDADGNALTEQRYTVYLKNGAKPVMPTLAQTGMTVPSNTFEKTVANPDGSNTTTTEQKYVLSGWSVDQSGVGDKNGTQQGVYVVESQYQSAITQDTEFYAIWINEDVEDTGSQAYFFIRMDGTIPQEPGGYTPSGYFPNGNYYWNLRGSIKSKINIVNDPEKVQKNIHTAPSVNLIIQQIEYSLLGSNEYGWTDTKNGDGELVYRGVTLTAANYGTVWTIEWYACKIADDSKTQWNVDGRVRFIAEYELTYWPNGGASANIPPSETHKANESVTIKYQNNNHYPQRTGYTFAGWSKNKDTTWQQVEAAADGADDGIWKKGSSEALMMPAEDVDLYAIWKPEPKLFTINGYKYVIENGRRTLATERYSFLIEELDEAGNVINSVTMRNNSRGELPLEIHLNFAGLHTLRITEIKGDDPLMVYDSAVYMVTVYVGDSDNGLYIVGETVTRNNVLLSEKKIEFENRIGERDVSVTKVWDDNNDQDGIRPSYIVVDLLRDGASVGQYQTLNAVNGWSATWTGLPIATGNKQHVYTVRESQVGAGYTSTTTGDMDTGFTITNEHVPETTEVTVTKQWVDDSNVAQVRPENVTLTLTGSDGSTRTAAVTGTGDSWTYTFTGLPVYYNGGAQITYTVDETDVPAGYTKTVNGNTVTNTLQRDLTFVVNKEIKGNMADPNKEFEFAVDILAADQKTVIRTETFKLKHNGTKTITGIPYGAYVQVTEDPAGYTAQHVLGTVIVDRATYMTEQPITSNGWGVTFINTKEMQIDTGVDLDGLPYTLLLLGAAGLGVLWMLLIARRRRDEA